MCHRKIKSVPLKVEMFTLRQSANVAPRVKRFAMYTKFGNIFLSELLINCSYSVTSYLLLPRVSTLDRSQLLIGPANAVYLTNKLAYTQILT